MKASDALTGLRGLMEPLPSAEVPPIAFPKADVRTAELDNKNDKYDIPKTPIGADDETFGTPYQVRHAATLKVLYKFKAFKQTFDSKVADLLHREVGFFPLFINSYHFPSIMPGRLSHQVGDPRTPSQVFRPVHELVLLTTKIVKFNFAK